MNHIESPRTDDTAIEQEIKAKGLTAPRVTPADLAANIARAYYFTAKEGVDGCDLEQMRREAPDPQLTFVELNKDNPPEKSTLAPLMLLTFCVLVLKNGFTVTGESACASPENFDAEIGRKIAFENAKQKIWPLMGYELKQRLHQMQQPAQAPVESALPPYQQRVVAEKAELDERLQKLRAFLASDAAKPLSPMEIDNLAYQEICMGSYSDALRIRIDAFKGA